jgi:hypothetical protein
MCGVWRLAKWEKPLWKTTRWPYRIWFPEQLLTNMSYTESTKLEFYASCLHSCTKGTPQNKCPDSASNCKPQNCRPTCGFQDPLSFVEPQASSVCHLCSPSCRPPNKGHSKSSNKIKASSLVTTLENPIYPVHVEPSKMEGVAMVEYRLDLIPLESLHLWLRHCQRRAAMHNHRQQVV